MAAAVAATSGDTIAVRWRVDDVVIVDNDLRPTAAPVVEELTTAPADPLPFRLRYVHEPTPGLAAARNRALDEATGRVLVFIDDDERAGTGWPAGLIEVMARTGAALVGGPVRTSFDHQPAAWIVAGGFFDRPEPADGSSQRWLRSGNLAIDVAAVRAASLRFDEAFAASGGEDVAFTRTARATGLGLAWSASAVVHEDVGPDRTTLGWLVGRERTSTANWVRVELRLGPSGPARARWGRRAAVAARAGARIVQGAALAAVGAATGRPATLGRGLVLAGRGVGAVEGLLDRGRSAAGPANYRPGNTHLGPTASYRVRFRRRRTRDTEGGAGP